MGLEDELNKEEFQENKIQELHQVTLSNFLYALEHITSGINSELARLSMSNGLRIIHAYCMIHGE